MTQALSRRRFLRTLFCSSAALSLNVHSKTAHASGPSSGYHLLALGDFGSAQPAQGRVARAMQEYCAQQSIHVEWLVLLGDNFYKNPSAGGGLSDARWVSGFEEMYPADHFPGPCPAVLGNHDYHDTPSGERVQLAYHLKGSGRWTLPAKWYRRDLSDLATFIFIDTNLRSVSGKKLSLSQPTVRTGCLTEEEEVVQWEWLKTQLSSPRNPFTVVAGHHPVYSNGHHGDTPELVAKLAPLLQTHGVQIYLAGHDHDLQHLELEGLKTSFLISGGGGAKATEMKNTGRPIPFAKTTYGFSHLHFHGKHCVIRHIDDSGTLLHSFSKTA